MVDTVAGSGGVAGNVDGIGAAARFNDPMGMALDSTGTYIYIADMSNSSIRRLTLSDFTVVTVSGDQARPVDIDADKFADYSYWRPAKIWVESDYIIVGNRFALRKIFFD